MKKVICLDTNEVFDSAAEAAKVYGVDRSTITKAARGILQTAAGKIWKYYEGDKKMSTKKELIEEIIKYLPIMDTDMLCEYYCECREDCDKEAGKPYKNCPLYGISNGFNDFYYKKDYFDYTKKGFCYGFNFFLGIESVNLFELWLNDYEIEPLLNQATQSNLNVLLSCLKKGIYGSICEELYNSLMNEGDFKKPEEIIAKWEGDKENG